MRKANDPVEELKRSLDEQRLVDLTKRLQELIGQGEANYGFNSVHNLFQSAQVHRAEFVWRAQQENLLERLKRKLRARGYQFEDERPAA